MPVRNRESRAAIDGEEALQNSNRKRSQDNSPSLRRSKRIRSTSNTDTAVTKESAKKTLAREINHSNGALKTTDVKVEKENSTTSTRSVRPTKKKQISYSDEAKADDDALVKTKAQDEEEEEEEQITITEKVKRKRNVKEEEVEMVPLAARTKGLQMFVGAHVSAAKGVHNAVTNSVHIGGNAFALFLKSQRKWDNPPLQDEHRDNFRQYCLDHQYDATKHILPHGSYLVNLAQEDEAKAKQAFDSFLDDLQRCEKLGIRLYNFHPGASGQGSREAAITRLAKALTKALAATSTVTPVLETMCGQGSTIGGPLSELGAVISQIPEEYHSRIGVCIDTCHSFAYGYDLVSPEGFRAFMTEFEEKIGLKYLRALHLNDSKAPRGSKRDLHANIGTGFLGLRAFHNVMNEKRFHDLPMILETPIDRPVSPSTNKTAAAEDAAAADASDTGSDIEKNSSPVRKKQHGNKKPKATKKLQRTVEDKSIWAREIKLLESLIGMDPESAEFRAMEAKLSEEGRAERERIQSQCERKSAAETKAREKNQRKLDEMFGAKGTKKRGKRRKDAESDSANSSGED